MSIPEDQMNKTKIVISAQEVLTDLKSGVDDQGLMTKYNLSYRQLQRLFRMLIQRGFVTPMELAGRLCVTQSQVTEVLRETKEAIEELE